MTARRARNAGSSRAEHRTGVRRLVVPRTAFDWKRTSCSRGGRQPPAGIKVPESSGCLVGGRGHADPRRFRREGENQLSTLRMRLSGGGVRKAALTLLTAALFSVPSLA